MMYILFIIVSFAIVSFFLYQWQYFMIFTPVYYRKDGICKCCEYLSTTTDDGVELEGVVYEPEEPKGTLLFFGGRSDDSVALINTLSQNYKSLRVVTFNYRSYGKSGGIANEYNLFHDGLHVAQLVQKHYGSFYVLGFSLGSSVATYVASKKLTQGVFLVGAFDSIGALVLKKYNLKVPSFFIRYKFETQKYIQEVNAPVALFASKNDDITYIENTYHLKNYIVNLACFEEFDGLSHQELLCYQPIVEKINRIIYEKESL